MTDVNSRYAAMIALDNALRQVVEGDVGWRLVRVQYDDEEGDQFHATVQLRLDTLPDCYGTI